MCGKRLTFLYTSPYEHVELNNIVIRAERVLVGIMLAQRRRRWPCITSALGQYIMLSGVFWRRDQKRHTHNNAVLGKHGTVTQCCFNVRPASKTVGQH